MDLKQMVDLEVSKYKRLTPENKREAFEMTYQAGFIYDSNKHNASNLHELGDRLDFQMLILKAYLGKHGEPR